VTRPRSRWHLPPTRSHQATYAGEVER